MIPPMFTDAELERYARQIVLRECGAAGQARLKAGRVAVIGAGGVGCPALAYLAAGGVGRLTVIDDDRVGISNLQRQILFGDADIGVLKVDAARTALGRINPHIQVKAVAERLSPANAETLLRDHDLVLDGSDRFETRLAVSDAANRLGLPLVSAAMTGFEIQIGVYPGHAAGGACYRCLVGAITDQPGQSCAETGVFAPIGGLAGGMAALESMRLMAGFGVRRPGRLIAFDGLTMGWRELTVRADPACACAR